MSQRRQDNVPLEKAILAMGAWREDVIRELKEVHAQVQSSKALELSWQLKAIEKALGMMFAQRVEAMVLEVHEVRDSRISQITYSPDLQILEAILTNGVVRHHRGVDVSRWRQVKQSGNFVEGYWDYVWDKVGCDEQYPERQAVKKLEEMV